MKCPHCKRTVGQPLDTGFMEAQKFQNHLRRCRKAPNNIVLKDAFGKTVVEPLWEPDLMEAVEERARSGQ